MKTLTGVEVQPNIRGLVYFFDYERQTPGKDATLKHIGTFQSCYSHEALNKYANTMNPASQLVMGSTQEEFEENLEQLHKNINDPSWVNKLGDYL